jgi:hypothetical protein
MTISAEGRRAKCETAGGGEIIKEESWIAVEV